MSLYNEAASFIDPHHAATGSLKSRIYASKGLKNKPSHIFALGSESFKWSTVISEVIERAGILELENKVRARGGSMHWWGSQLICVFEVTL